MTKNIQFHPGRKKNDGTKPRLLFKRYLTTVDYPPTVDWLSAVHSWPMYLNDRYGDCTCAAAGHIIQALSTYGQGSTQTISNNDVLAAYEAVSGFNPLTGENDDGAVMQDVLNYWRKSGIGGHKILAFAEVDVSDIDEVKAAANIFGTVYIGIDFPESAMDQFNDSKPWDVVKGSPIEGGHAINVGFYDTNTYRVVTWGEVQEMTQAFWDKYVEEAWIVITPEWLNEQGQSPGGLDLYSLGEDLAELTGGANPFPAPPPAPNPTPVEPPTDPDETLAQFLTEWFRKGHSLPHHAHLEAVLRAWLDSRQ